MPLLGSPRSSFWEDQEDQQDWDREDWQVRDRQHQRDQDWDRGPAGLGPRSRGAKTRRTGGTGTRRTGGTRIRRTSKAWTGRTGGPGMLVSQPWPAISVSQPWNLSQANLEFRPCLRMSQSRLAKNCFKLRYSRNTRKLIDELQ